MKNLNWTSRSDAACLLVPHQFSDRSQKVTRVLIGMIVFLSSAVSWACQTSDNLVQNCGFTTDASGWQTETGTCARDGSSGASGVGNMTCNSFMGGAGHVARFRRCLLAADGVSGGRTYNYSAYGQLVSGSGVNCVVEIADFTSNNCLNNVNSASTFLALATSPNYAPSIAATYSVAPNTVSAHVRIECTSPSSAFQVRVDDIYVGVPDPIFKSGFET